ncbi:hypothetical protein BSR29_00325 [Boudabousia liubingyangii]|uniref:Uncharacterized protein n=1 Tax=Boudabousia liubingyangii TaxID=1921764 RepID=A0A1Q5PPS5_9ACTO|nr:hypothetical protein [Boudabousia liubingyangii]OKL48514.1 hypothetical protein BSR28_02155 [Boudabousia liubingyangii]OKL49450.1 hypothetical protein BSR29_00325 [Boudabousia liubingyangii]
MITLNTIATFVKARQIKYLPLASLLATLVLFSAPNWPTALTFLPQRSIIYANLLSFICGSLITPYFQPLNPELENLAPIRSYRKLKLSWFFLANLIFISLTASLSIFYYQSPELLWVFSRNLLLGTSLTILWATLFWPRFAWFPNILLGILMWLGGTYNQEANAHIWAIPLLPADSLWALLVFTVILMVSLNVYVFTEPKND